MLQTFVPGMAKRKTGFLTCRRSVEKSKPEHTAKCRKTVSRSLSRSHMSLTANTIFPCFTRCRTKTVSHEVDPDSAIGLDVMSMHEFYVDSEGNHVDYGKPYHDLQGRISREQRKPSHRRRKGLPTIESSVRRSPGRMQKLASAQRRASQAVS